MAYAENVGSQSLSPRQSIKQLRSLTLGVAAFYFSFRHDDADTPNDTG
jgi:hypothetical protein